MSDVAIRAEGLSKRYRIGQFQKYKTLRDTLTDALHMPFRHFRSTFQSSNVQRDNSDNTIWAIKDVSFEVKRGEVVGIIGRNGAGKSTLLKILSRITEPTEGYAEIRGRVGSLLEVGTGFHPELTGRENIYLNGAILGMKKTEINRKFDEIVAFAEIERFIDTSVKYYSSGMYLRLAFAVAAHLEPDILLVDEVLAVGDASFQRKCLGKLGQVAGVGRTVLFVSHNMAAVVRLCHRACLLDNGNMILDDKPGVVVKRYLGGQAHSPAEKVWDSPATAPGNEVVRLHAVRIRDNTGRVTETIDIREALTVELVYWCLQDGARLAVHLRLMDEEGEFILVAGNATLEQWHNKPHPIGLYRAVCHIPGNFLNEGRITVTPALITVDPNIEHVAEREAVSFIIRDPGGPGTARGDFLGRIPGAVLPLLPWTMECEFGERAFSRSEGHSHGFSSESD